MSRNCVFSKGRYFAVSPEDPVCSGHVRDDREREGRGVMAEATAHHEVPADHDPACEPGAMRARAVRTRSKRRTPDFEIVRERNHNDRCRLRVLGRQGDIGRAGGRTSPILVTRSSTTQVTTADALPCKGHSASLVCSGCGTSDCGNG